MPKKEKERNSNLTPGHSMNAKSENRRTASTHSLAQASADIPPCATPSQCPHEPPFAQLTQTTILPSSPLPSSPSETRARQICSPHQPSSGKAGQPVSEPTWNNAAFRLPAAIRREGGAEVTFQLLGHSLIGLPSV